MKGSFQAVEECWKSVSGVAAVCSLVYRKFFKTSTDGYINRKAFYCIFPSPINSLYLHLCVGKYDCAAAAAWLKVWSHAHCRMTATSLDMYSVCARSISCARVRFYHVEIFLNKIYIKCGILL